MAMRRVLAALLFVACAEPPEPAAPVRSANDAPLLLDEDAPTAAPPEARTVPQRFETRHIGSDADPAARRFSGAPVDLDVKDADIHDVIRLLADVGHANIVVADDVSGKVTVKLKRVPWDQALDVVTRAKGLAIERDGAVFLVSGKPLKPRD